MSHKIIGPDAVEEHRQNLGKWAASESGKKSVKDLESLIERINRCSDDREAIRLLMLQCVKDSAKIYRLEFELDQVRDQLSGT